ncbi:MAG: ABC transporter permease [Candidatus Heimdallarchaeota archaeon]|nr:ABC transporter permease [Candidatus Heimdallarchaeota archaeon]MCK5048948.1 ABC transporter permease [Candidatus Heimdallarchaeota archaeon]
MVYSSKVHQLDKNEQTYEPNYELTSPIKGYFAMVKKEFTRLKRYPVDFFGSFITIALILFVFILAVQSFVPPDSGKMIESASTMLYGFILFILVSDAIWMVGSSIAQERRLGTLESLYLSPANKFMNLFGRITIALVMDLLISIFCIFLGWWIIGGLIINNVLPALVVILLFAFIIFGLGLMFAGLTLELREMAQIIANLGQFFFLIFSAMMAPFSALPDFLLPISYAIPLSYPVDLFRSLLIGTEPELIPIFWEWVVVVVLAIIMPILGYKYYQRCERKVLKEGTLSQY